MDKWIKGGVIGALLYVVIAVVLYKRATSADAKELVSLHDSLTFYQNDLVSVREAAKLEAESIKTMDKADADSAKVGLAPLMTPEDRSKLMSGGFTQQSIEQDGQTVTELRHKIRKVHGATDVRDDELLYGLCAGAAYSALVVGLSMRRKPTK